MKKTLAIFLALITLTSTALVACNKNKTTTGGNNVDDDDDEGGYVLQQSDTDTDTDTDTDDDKKDNGSAFSSVSYTIYSMGNEVRVRSSTSTASEENIVGKLDIGDSVTATAVNNKWYKVTYNNTEAYVSKTFVTTKQSEATFKPCTEEVIKIDDIVVDSSAEKDIDKYAKVTLRTDPVVDGKTATKHVLIYTDTANGELKKVATNEDNTWWKVKYTYTPTGETEPTTATFYIGSGAFKYLEGYTGGSSGGLG